MKYWLTILAMVVIAGGCGPKEPIPDLAGNWIWASTLTDARPDSTNPSTPGNAGKTMSFRLAGNKWLLTNNGSLTDSGSYRTGWEKIGSGKYVKAIYFQRAGKTEDSVQYFKKYGDTLVFSYGFLGQDGENTFTYVLKRSQLP